jgi:cell division protein FtsB
MGKEPKKIKLYFTILVVFSIFMIFLTLFGAHGVLELKKLTNKYKGMLDNIAAVKVENRKLRIEIDKLKTSKNYIEELARKEFGMVKEGEIVFLFQD